MSLHPGSPDTTAFSAPWWANAVTYRLDLRSYADSNGDGVGDIDGARDRLGYLELLGVDLVWLTTLIRAPLDVANWGRQVDPVIGDMESFEMFIAEAHAAGMRVSADMSVNLGTNVEVDVAATVRFWLDKGLDGLRIASPSHLGEPAQDDVHEILQLIRPIIEDYPGRGVGALVDGTWFTRYGRTAQLDVGIDLRLSDAGFNAAALREAITNILNTSFTTGIRPSWILADRYQTRPVTRFGGGTTGLARARALMMITMALPGMPGVDNGDELGLPDARQPGRAGGDRVRGPMPWEGTEPPYGFSTALGSWWPLPTTWADRTVEAQLEDTNSTLSLYRTAMRLRREHPGLRGEEVEWFGAPNGCLAFRRGPDGVTCALNTSNRSVPMPPGTIVLASTALPGSRLPPDTAVWLEPA